MKSYTTPNGKEVQIVRNERGDYKIQFGSGGELPEYLTGFFTRMNAAEQAVQRFLSEKETVGRGKASK